MGNEWLDDIFGNNGSYEDDIDGSFYCPYTNAAKCAVLIKGWQPQELCEALDCEQLKFIKRARRGQNRAA